MTKDNPCHGCTDRHAGCHGKCEAYLDWHEQHVQKQREIRSKIEAETGQTRFTSKPESESKRRSADDTRTEKQMPQNR